MLPQCKEVDALAKTVTALKKSGIRSPFVHIDLRKFLPTWGQSEGQKAEAASEGDKGALLPFQWAIAWDKYALAAAATGQLTPQAGMAHKMICAEVAMRAESNGRRQILGVIYDDLAREAVSLIVEAHRQRLPFICCRIGRRSLLQGPVLTQAWRR